MQRYNPKVIEPKWQKKWEETGIYKANDTQASPKKYILEYFPYPSGAAMHVGHVRNYTIGDAISRFARMRNYNVLHPMGWDAFGLPAENYAIKTGVSPRQAVDENTKKFKQQLMQMGFSYDWSREIDSTDPKYYKWTQWFFLLLLKRGLAYQQESLQWWCPFDKTVLANEQVENGRCWRCGSEVEKKALKQWFFKITDYADRLEKDLDNVNWSDSIKLMQRNWIGRSKGAIINFAAESSQEIVSVFTTRPDTLFGATFLVLAPEHPLTSSMTTAEHKSQVEHYLAEIRNKSEIDRMETNREKTGVFTGAYVINPATHQKIPIWVADYVLMGYGTGAIMAVPAHDERDYEFAKKFKLPITHVINPIAIRDDAKDMVAFVHKKQVVALVQNESDELLTINWGSKLGGRLFVGGTMEVNESPEETAIREVKEETGYVDLEVQEVGSEIFYYKYYAFSKKEAHDAEIKFVFLRLKSHEKVVQKLDDAEKNNFIVEWVSPAAADHEIAEPLHRYAFEKFILRKSYSGEGLITNSKQYDGLSSSEMREKIVADLVVKGVAEERINYKMRDWLISRQRYWGTPIPVIHCPKDGAVPVPEDQLPVQLPELKKFEPSGDGRSPLANIPGFVNTTCPKCGGPAERETDTMDGFACSSWYFLRFADPHNDTQPFDPKKVKYWLPVDDYIGGAEHAVMHLLYARFWTKVMYDEGLINFNEPFITLRNHGMILAPDGQKMSKSKGNTIEPGGLIEQGYGADSIRIMELFIGPWNQAANWSVEGMGGAFRFLQRAWTLVQEFNESDHKSNTKAITTGKGVVKAAHRTIKQVSQDLEQLGFNTAIASLMEYVNDLYKFKASDNFADHQNWQFALETLVQLLAPFAPHISEELWCQLGRTHSVHISDWPVHDNELLVSETMTIVVQINGKLRAQLKLPATASEADIVNKAKTNQKIVEALQGQRVMKSIYVSHKLVNLVTK